MFGLNIRQIIIGIIIYAIVIAFSTYCWKNGNTIPYNLLHKIGILIGIIASFNYVRYLTEQIKFVPNRFLINSSFFIYGYHGITIALIMKTYAKLVPLNEGTIISGYFLLYYNNCFWTFSLFLINEIIPEIR